jgi:hypothetical protein
VTGLSHNDPIHVLRFSLRHVEDVILSMPFTPTLSFPALRGLQLLTVHFPIRYYYSNVTLLLLIESYFMEFIAESESGRFMNTAPGNNPVVQIRPLMKFTPRWLYG